MIVSPFVFTVLYGIGVVNGGRVFEALGAGLFILVFGGHVAALSAIRKTSSPPKTFRLPTFCVDIGLILIHLLVTAGGVTIGSINATNENLRCRLEFSVPSMNYTDGTMMDYVRPTGDVSTTTSDIDSGDEFHGYCGPDVSLFLATMLLLCVRCWHLPIIVKLKNYSRKKR
ncbi:hypothetical protein FO519_008308 [Halicephalobus sp. NKZ332]|nr:hypothetical protein FO519_008308 [Halicephalobus sp. NKZ332]